MNSRGCALVILVLIVAVLAWGILSAVPDLPVSLPDIKWPSFNILPTIGSLQTSIPTIIGNIPSTLTPRLTVTPFPTPAEKIVHNGRLIFVGFDGAIWSAEVAGNSAANLGSMMDSHLFSSNPWYSPDGRYALVARKENGQNYVFLVRTDGKIPELRLGAAMNPSTFEPRDVFAFAPDGRRFFYLDTTSNPANLIIVTLDDFSSFTWPIQAGSEELTYVSFWGDSDHLIIKSYDPNLQAHFLEVFLVGQTLTEPRRLVARNGYQIIQFVVSPDAGYAAIVFRNFAENSPDELQILNIRTGEQIGVNVGGPGRVVLTSPAWSPDSRFVLFNTWSNENGELLYHFMSFDTRTKLAVSLLDEIKASTFGQPLCRVFSFAEDGLGVGVRLFGDVPNQVSSSLVLMDGSYHREIARFSTANGVPGGLYVAGFIPDWTRAIMIEMAEGNRVGSLYVSSLDGSNKEVLDDQVPYEFLELGPVISPDGEWVAYLRTDQQNGKATLSIVKIDGSDRRELFSGTGGLGEGLAPAGLPLIWLPAP